jgi:hypothetical protein
MNASKLISGAIVGLDFKTILVNGKAYAVLPPTIAKIAGATYYLSDLSEADTLNEVLKTLSEIEKGAKALSWLVKGDESLSDEFIQAPFEDVVNGLEIALSLISAESFIKLSTLARSVRSLTAKQR